ncbi:MAG TPA: helix-turn-helix domain-containing protein [Candidatus Mediterraneibacter intestinipullorum]|nr:helix-turn-helix domain-containing protein [Candidatus Mediterraneibacter intestinipullorum]
MGCRYASLVTANLLRQTAAANLPQGRRIHVMSQKSIRDKLLLFLKQNREERNDILLTMNRQELADYLGTERSALSREMARMKKEGLIDYCRNEIKILGEN